ncbi:hypothetical protein CASFOL_009374 [Castilleja foliolosa]|uniref:Uncharacterized protein n=1 Tax=Castilleja foliolosa TaxID=1961234 RepID=A0ABD3DX60_9LAMI
MGGQNVSDKWYVNLWKSSRKSLSREPEKPALGIMAFEVSRLMSKVVSLWQSLSDRQIVRLREEIANSIGIRKLVSENEANLMDLAFSEIIENLKTVANAVAMLGKKCTDSTFHNLDRIFNCEDEIDPKWVGNKQYKLKEMDSKVRKMGKFVAATEQLYQELEVLAELEQSLRRMRAGPDVVKTLEFQQKVMRQREEVKNLREISPWVRTYDHIVCLLLRSTFTIIERIKCVNVYEQRNNDFPLIRSNSLRQTSIYPSETNSFGFSVPVGRSFSNLGFGPPKIAKSHSRSQSSVFGGKQGRLFTHAGFARCMNSERQSPVVENSFRSNETPRKKDGMKLKDILTSSENQNPAKVPFFDNPKSRPLDPPPSTLGHAALALRYANIIILIEKLASSPNLISHDAKDDLYDMLPRSVRSCLRARLRTFSRSLGSSACNAAFAADWRLAVDRILEWLCPLAHDTVRWQSERNFERQRLSFGSNVRLVQTLYFADQVETEGAIVELLMGLNFLFRVGREVNQRTDRESSCSRAFDGCMLTND